MPDSRGFIHLEPCTNRSGIVGTCSRQLAVLATTREKPGTESRFPHPFKERKGIGSPGGRTPKPLRGCLDDADTQTGNPDVRVPGIIKTEEGLSGKRVPNKEDAGGGGEKVKDENGVDDERRRTPNPKPCSVKDTTPKKETTESREFRHIPGGKWLPQVRSFLKDNLKLNAGREGAAGEGTGGVR
ncbi:hypothetical protein NDU88_002629 [Pleurodeles waltl]|uniref:Uncharacterized protein n=1 Tax=Pleurodeles waltl TaxID=8319 RepID=A0AAV7LJC1_PLEWA|nr:hypothetical protein NDU88_002629 [Pleurodeles waltl]